MLLSVVRSILSDRGREKLVPPVQATHQLKNSLRYKRGGRILVFIAGSEGDALKELSLDTVRPLRVSSDEVIAVDLRRQGFLEALDAAIEQPVWFALSSFGAGQEINITTGDTVSNLWATAGVPFVRVFGDIPAYFPDRHIPLYSNSINLYGFPEHIDFFRRWFSKTGLNVRVSPILFDVLPERPSSLDRKLKGTIVFPKNGNDPDRLIRYWRSSLPPAIAAALESIGEEIGSANVIDGPPEFAERLVRHFLHAGLDIAGEKSLLFFLIAQLDDYLRRVKSTMIARALLDLPVVIRGINWDHLDFSGRRARHDPDSSYSPTRRIIDDALAIIDMSPNTQHSPHDRVLRASGRYTAFLTNQQTFFSENFANHAEFTFSFSADAIRERTENALADPRGTVELGLFQADRMRALTDENRYVSSIVAAVDACALANGARPEGTQDFVIFPPTRF